ncbi:MULTISPECIES: hypothetical protein [Enterobacteriaceae]|uniref:hypothetical protein n=1 Tax=Enterobacteriaceae TaxID=543 RepID=UPI000F8275C1|nr:MULTISPECIES: hypothetical protein [Enterobacteriaceae]EMB2216098.1 hypothetical protein [Enterobacter hormaechei subsp. hoffmannii]MXG73979.1 hypothetical protein [Escherichia coli]MBT1694738.1 hypothetical protein [Enterobacter hormaechei subsp. hoffmannii]MBT1738573.1 hypothetical protein [Enterobacter hormaechei subsp. hoffmannii]MCE1574811.1 hypothetical protein [Enterobacter hormaechei]
MREEILDKATKIESLLCKLGGSGRGMHEKLSSIEQIIDTTFVKKIRWIASVRNKAAHEADFYVDIADFIEGADQVIAYLETIIAEQHQTSKNDGSKESKGWNEMSGWEKAGTVAVIGAGIVFTLFKIFE